MTQPPRTASSEFPRLRTVTTPDSSGSQAPSLQEQGVPARFIEALTSIRDADRPRGLLLEEVPAPRRLAPWSAALSVETVSTVDAADADSSGTPLATSRLVILHDPDEPAAWDGDFRLVMQVTARLDDEVGTDPALAHAAWSWLTQALDESGAGYHALVGTVTRVLSDTFGGLALTDACAHAEVRASWTPATTDLGPHLAAWYTLVHAAAGQDPDAVHPLPRSH